MQFIRFNKKPDIDLCWEDKKYMKYIVKKKKKKVFSFHAGKKGRKKWREGDRNTGKKVKCELGFFINAGFKSEWVLGSDFIKCPDFLWKTHQWKEWGMQHYWKLDLLLSAFLQILI